MKMKKLYVNKTDIIIILLVLLVFLILSVPIIYFIDDRYLGVITNASALLCVLSYMAYTYRRNLASNIYDTNTRHNYKQIEAMFNLFSLYRFNYPLPEMRHWAVSPDALLYIIRTAMKFNVNTIVECGSGVSTIVLAKYLEQKGAGHIYSLDHDKYYADKTNELLKLHGLDQFATVIVAPLGEVKLDNKQYFWYSTECIDAIPQGIDMLFVDGPPAREGTYNRYPALPMFKEKVTKDCVIIMDDVNRPDEFEISRLWAGILGRKNIAYHDVEKGMAII